MSIGDAIRAAQDTHCKRFCPWDNKRCKLLGGDWDYECEDRETIYYEIMYGDTTIPSDEG